MKTYLLTFVLIFMTLTMNAQNKNNLALVSFNNTEMNRVESNAAENFILTKTGHSLTTIDYTQLINREISPEQFDIIWFHSVDDYTSAEIEDELITLIRDYVNNGGRIFLSVQAVTLLNRFGFESVKIQSQPVQARDRGYGRKLGLHAFRSHPIFERLNGGTYLFNPTENIETVQYGFFEDSVPQNGKVAAVDWSYITLAEESKLVYEYEFGNGKILGVGAYLYFSIENKNRKNLEVFTNNCLDYLNNKSENEQKFYWDYSPVQIQSFDSIKEMNHKINLISSKEWDSNPGSFSMKRSIAEDNFWNVAGERMLVMGKEKGGIEEIWSHPFMALRDYEAAIKFENDDTIYKLKDLEAAIITRPESFTRKYRVADGAEIIEVITASPTEPAAVIHYEYNGTKNAEFIITFKSNMRYMWPYSERAFGKLYYDYNHALNSFIIKDKSGEFVSMVGTNKSPLQKNIDHFNGYDISGALGKGIQTDELIVSAYSTYNFESNDKLDVIICASNEGLKKTADVFSEVLYNPVKIHKDAENYVKDFFENSISIETPDADFNEGYKWSLIGSDRFFVHTPGLGKALVAGYGTTDRGWNGRQRVSGRPGYSWYFGRDAVWSGFAFLDFGDFEKIKLQLNFFNDFQDLNGKIFHELTTSGVVHYDASDATPLYIILAGKYLLSSGDTEFIKNSWNHIRKALEYCYSTDTDGDHLIENTGVGHGWVEGGGLFKTHTEVYLAACWAEALRLASIMAEEIGLNNESEKYKNEYETVRNIINSDFWSDENDYLSFSKLSDGSFNNEKTVLAAVPVYFETVEDEKAIKIVDDYAYNDFSSDWGLRILSSDSEIFDPEGYHTGSVWPLFTGWGALAEYKTGFHIQGFSHIMNNLLVYKNWQLGYVEEVLHGAEYKPEGVCSHQCWSQTMVIQPVIEGMLGLNVNAPGNELSLSPQFPADWDKVNIKRIRIGNDYINVSMVRRDNTTVYKFTTSTENIIGVNLNLSFPHTTSIEKIKINDSEINQEISENQLHIKFDLNQSAKIEIAHRGGISVLPVILLPEPGDKSKGMRIISDRVEDHHYIIEVEGMSGSKNELRIWKENKVETITVVFDESSSSYVQKEIKIEL
ncbi:MAG: hypothetical protein K9J16_13930 [Melioribacteraceae bacterium]|nr:hypothetical protein [Melioribacteraceae bacterium]MCF8355579.1 hypothetical protein [Melioribacteraceae bacterium]MCF8395042.1 hypothetical protein [Melioribacteraceae bacterium]MCF8420496.1 hypothetical protein [Melioribacteraceae bacterium]